MPPNANRKSDKPAAGPTCPSCGATTLAEATFCHACGRPMAGRLGRSRWSARKLVGLAAVAALIGIGVFAIMTFSAQKAEPPLSPLSVLPAPVFDAPPDLSQMTARDAADRLFNRIMRASEQGNHAEALRFVPMAVQAYGNLPLLDLDAHYHLGLIHGVAGDRAQGERHIAAMRQAAPNHLLALMLEHAIAERSGDRATISKIIARFATAYDSEITIARPEYIAHRNTIERFRRTAK